MHLITENVPHWVFQEQDQHPAGPCPWIGSVDCQPGLSSAALAVTDSMMPGKKTSWIQRKKNRFVWHESCSHPTEDLKQLHRWWWSSSQFGFGLGMRAQVKPEIPTLLWTWAHISQRAKKSCNQPIQHPNDLYKNILDSSTHPAAPNASPIPINPREAPGWKFHLSNGSLVTDLPFPLLLTKTENSS